MGDFLKTRNLSLRNLEQELKTTTIPLVSLLSSKATPEGASNFRAVVQGSQQPWLQPLPLIGSHPVSWNVPYLVGLVLITRRTLCFVQATQLDQCAGMSASGGTILPLEQYFGPVVFSFAPRRVFLGGYFCLAIGSGGKSRFLPEIVPRSVEAPKTEVVCGASMRFDGAIEFSSLMRS